MEISPIIGIRVMPTVKTPPAESALTAIFDIDATAKPGDDTYSGAKKKGAGAEESDEEVLDADTEAPRTFVPTEDGLARNINYFA